MRGEHSVTINRPAHVIFDVIADGTRNPTWRQSVIDVSLHSGTGGVGSVWREVVHGPAGKAADSDYRVTTHERPSAYGFEIIAGPVRGTGLYTLTAGDDGETMVSFDITLRPRGAMRLLTGFVLRRVVDEVENLDRLRDLLTRTSADAV